MSDLNTLVVMCFGYETPELPSTQIGNFGYFTFSPQFPEDAPDVVLWSPPVKTTVTKVIIDEYEYDPTYVFQAPGERVKIVIEGTQEHEDYSDLFTYTIDYTPMFTGVVGNFTHFTAINDSNTYVKLYDNGTFVWSFKWRTHYPHRIIKEILVNNLGNVYIGWIDTVTLESGMTVLTSEWTSEIVGEEEIFSITPVVTWDDILKSTGIWISTNSVDSETWDPEFPYYEDYIFNAEFVWNALLNGYIYYTDFTIYHPYVTTMQETWPFVGSRPFTKAAFLVSRHPDYPWNLVSIKMYTSWSSGHQLIGTADVCGSWNNDRNGYPEYPSTATVYRVEMDLDPDLIGQFDSIDYSTEYFYEDPIGSGNWYRTNPSMIVVRDILFFDGTDTSPPNIDLFLYQDGSTGAITVNASTTCITHLLLNNTEITTCYPHDKVLIDPNGVVFLWDDIISEWVQISIKGEGVVLANTEFIGCDYTVDGTIIDKSRMIPANTEFIGILPTLISGSGIKVPVPPAFTSFTGIDAYVAIIITALPANTSFTGIGAIINSFINSPPANTEFGPDDLTVQEFISIYDKLCVKGVPANVDHGATGISYAFITNAIIITGIGKSINGKLANTEFEGIPINFYYIRGQVVKDGVPAIRTVRAYSSLTGFLLGEVESDTLGFFEIGNLPFDGSTVFVVCQDLVAVPVILDHILPGA
jgi:hypothetical protein